MITPNFSSSSAVRFIASGSDDRRPFEHSQHLILAFDLGRVFHFGAACRS